MDSILYTLNLARMGRCPPLFTLALSGPDEECQPMAWRLALYV